MNQPANQPTSAPIYGSLDEMRLGFAYCFAVLLGEGAAIFARIAMIPDELARGSSSATISGLNAATFFFVFFGASWMYGFARIDHKRLGRPSPVEISVCIATVYTLPLFWIVYNGATPHLTTSGGVDFGIHAPAVASALFLFSPIILVPLTTWALYRRPVQRIAAAEVDEHISQRQQVETLTAERDQYINVIDAEREEHSTAIDAYRTKLDAERRKSGVNGTAAIYYYRQAKSYADQAADEKRWRDKADQRADITDKENAALKQENVEISQQLAKVNAKLARPNSRRASVSNYNELWQTPTDIKQIMVTAVIEATSKGLGAAPTRKVTRIARRIAKEDGVHMGEGTPRGTLEYLSENNLFVTHDGSSGNQWCWRIMTEEEMKAARRPSA